MAYKKGTVSAANGGSFADMLDKTNVGGSVSLKISGCGGNLETLTGTLLKKGEGECLIAKMVLDDTKSSVVTLRYRPDEQMVAIERGL